MRSGRKAMSAISRAARSSTSLCCCTTCRRRRSPAPGSTSSSTSRASRRSSSRSTTRCCSPTSAAPPPRRARRWATARSRTCAGTSPASRSSPGSSRPLGRRAGSGSGLALQPVLQALPVDEIELHLEPVDVLFLGLEDLLEQLARDVILHRLAVGNRLLQRRARSHLELEVAFERFARAFADHQLAEILQVPQPLEEKDTFDQPVGVLHLVDRFLLLVLLEPLQTPVAEHAGVEEVLVNRGELIEQHLVQMPDDLRVAFHGPSPSGCGHCQATKAA